MAEGARLESVCGGNLTGGSNPPLSARKQALVVLGGELAVPCTCNPLQQDRIPPLGVRTAAGRVEDPEGDGMPAWTQAAWVTPGAAGQRSLPAAQRAILRSLLAAEGG